MKLAARKSTYKPASVTVWTQDIKALIEFFGADCRLSEITAAQAEEFSRHLVERGLRPTTIHKRLQHARLFFKDALRRGLVATNPFEYVRHPPGDVSERRRYIPVTDAQRLIEYAPNVHWKLLIALARFAGSRIPSQALSLRWRDVDWERERLTIPSPKTQHPPARGYRVIPLFPSLRPYLDAAWNETPVGAEYAFPEEFRRQAEGKDGWKGCNLRTMLTKLMRRAGLEPWPRPWHNTRASCESDLASEFPLATVAKWLGHTPAVALRHYLDVTDADFEKALQAHRIGGAKSGAVQTCTEFSGSEDQDVTHRQLPLYAIPGIT